MTTEELMARLRQEDLLPADAAAIEREVHGPWYGRLMLGCGAWIAAILLTIALGIAGALHESGSRLIVGALLCILARTLMRGRPGEFLGQFQLAAFMTGEICLLTVWEGRWGEPDWGLWEGALLALLIVAFPDRAARFLSTVLAGIILAVVMAHEGLQDTGLIEVSVVLWAWVTGALFLEQEALLARVGPELQRPLAYGAVTNLYGFLWMAHWEHSHSTGALTLSAVLTLFVTWLAARVQRRLELTLLPGLISLGACLALGALTASAPGLMAGLGLLVLGFHAREPLLQGIAWLFLMTFGIYFYYSLTLGLLVKSVLLMGAGSLCLMLRRGLA